MRIINSFQLMLLFASMPFLITWTKDADFYAHTVLFWVLVVAYLISFGSLVALVAENLKD